MGQWWWQGKRGRYSEECPTKDGTINGVRPNDYAQIESVPTMVFVGTVSTMQIVGTISNCAHLRHGFNRAKKEQRWQRLII